MSNIGPVAKLVYEKFYIPLMKEVRLLKIEEETNEKDERIQIEMETTVKEIREIEKIIKDLSTIQ